MKDTINRLVFIALFLLSNLTYAEDNKPETDLSGLYVAGIGLGVLALAANLKSAGGKNVHDSNILFAGMIVGSTIGLYKESEKKKGRDLSVVLIDGAPSLAFTYRY